ncbi:3'-5' exoribonuclease [Tepidimonas taiwanensis]|uniref:3'-5' exoribonuclease n=2 Tax=Tepidimonas taiwanensis TaxID=307486 RepID=A0A554X2V0_9BURK|nr:3'-5' exoribonuclease [Tepidimonas taiwanensis]
MRVFVDTEFTDFEQPRLISVGLVAEDGRTGYWELADGWRREQCSAFVVEDVLPLLDGTGMPRAHAGPAIAAWLGSAGEGSVHGVTLIADTDTDLRLLTDLVRPHWRGPGALDAQRLQWPANAMAARFEDLLKALLENEPRRHHALVDARALQRAVLQTEAEFRARR